MFVQVPSLECVPPESEGGVYRSHFQKATL